MKIEEYIDKLFVNDLDHNHWFMTKQTMSDYYFPFFISRIVEAYPIHHTSQQNFASFYTDSFRHNSEASALYPTQCDSENTYRNAIITEFLGLTENEERQYAKAHVTKAYKKLREYIEEKDDIDKHKDIIDHQIEKICLNVIPSSKYDEVKSVTIFPVIYLYKILVELYKKYGDSKLNYDEFSLFVIRSEKYGDYKNVIDLIEQYRSHSYSHSYNAKINTIINHQSSKNVRFNALFGSLEPLDYVSWESYRIKSDKESYNYILNVIKAYENSVYFNETNKTKLLEFMRSDKYFVGEIDNVVFEETLNPEEFKQLIEREDEFLEKLKKLAEQYGEDGTTTVLNTVRLSSVQKAFRDKLIQMHGQKCLMCGVTNKELLVASHIKQASACKIEDKANYENGFLLCAIHDKLFDRLLITFNFFDGKIKISPSLTEEEKRIFALDENYHLPKSLLTSDRIKYLMWHNEQYYKKAGNK